MKNFRKYFYSLLCLFAGSLAFAAGPVNYTSINFNFQVLPSQSWIQVLRSQQEWQEFYQTRVYPGFYMPTPDLSNAPIIDFSNYTLIVGGLGFVYLDDRLAINGITENDSGIYVDAVWTTLIASRDCAVAAAGYTPTKYLLIPKTNKPVYARVQRSYYPCFPSQQIRVD